MKTIEQFIEDARKKHGDKYNYSQAKYAGAKEKLEIICPEHGSFFQTPTAHLRPVGCPGCGIDTIKSKRWGEHNAGARTKFIRKAALKHDNKYDYNKVEWLGSKKKVEIICPEHGPFMQSPEKHLFGNGCPTCGKNKSANLKRSNTSEFIEKARITHGDKYDYSPTVYLENEGSVEIICPTHGSFWQRASNHLQGKGCLRCSNNEPMTQDEFIERAQTIHSTKYDYSKTKYTGAKDKLTVICRYHGEFSQLADAHLSGQGCPYCSVKISKGESEVFAYVKKFCPDAVQSDRVVLDGKEIDIFIPSRNIGIEFNGLIWHSTKYGKSRTYHQDKSDLAASKGVRLIHIWEDEWRDRRAWCEAFIARLFADTSRKVFARKCDIRKIESDLAKPFLNDNHLQGFRGGQHIGMFHGDELVAVATHGMNQKGEHELLRWCVKLGVSVVGGFSRMMKQLPENIISFCDTAKHDASGYLASGWKIHSETVLMYYYTNGIERVSRQRFQKHKLMKIQGAKGDTEKELAASLGFFQLGALKQLKLVRC